ncbi:MAG: VOC family protein [Phycisphaerae bacterium]|nr:VOC family protein [Phycisphaerae bacterium]
MTMKTVPVTSGMFCWFELTTHDAARGAAFYRDLMRAATRGLPLHDGDLREYVLFDVEGQTVAGLMPMGKEFPPASASHWLPYVAVDNVDTVAARVPQLGGRVCCGPSDIPIGRFAVVADPTGGTFALFHPTPGKTDGTNPVGPGAFVWCELVTSDIARSSEFYAKLLGWTPEFRTAGASSFIEMKAGKQSVASVFEACADESSLAHWCPYLCVDDIHARLADAVRLGATKLCEPMDIPGVGLYAGVTDPTGAHIALYQPIPT